MTLAPEENPQPWTAAEIRRRHGERGTPKRSRCGLRRANGTVCAKARALAAVVTAASMFGHTQQWELGHCTEHLTDAERDFAEVVGRVSHYEDSILIASGRALLDEIERLESRELDRQSPDRPPVPGLPACWAWMREDIESQAAGSVVRPTASTLREMWDWQMQRCAVCGEHGVTDLDHDHWSDLVRGFLCKSCNVAGAEEARSGFYWPVASGPWARYRQLNPARWLRFRKTYTAAQHEQRFLDPTGGGR